jgi:protein transport protein SEC24
LYYFSIPRDGSENNDPSMLVVSDLDEPFLPTPDNLLVTLSECMANVQNFLEKLPTMFQDNPQTGSAMGSALRAGHRMTAAIGAKITVLSSSLPNAGFGKLENRERKDILGTSKEGSLLQTQNAFYKSFAVECSKNQVSIDMFLFSSAYQDVASLSNLPRYTGGQTWFYPGWNAARPEDAIKLAHEFTNYLSSEIGLEAVLRVRASTGLRMSAFYGNFFNRSSDLCAFPSFPRDQQYNVEVAIDETINRPQVFLQAAVLHTSCNGTRRIRVLTLGLPTTDKMADVYASADSQAITTYFSHKAVERALSSGLDAARDALQSKVIEILSTYRTNLAGGSSGGLSTYLVPTIVALLTHRNSSTCEPSCTPCAVPWSDQKRWLEEKRTNTFRFACRCAMSPLHLAHKPAAEIHLSGFLLPPRYAGRCGCPRPPNRRYRNAPTSQSFIRAHRALWTVSTGRRSESISVS